MNEKREFPHAHIKKTVTWILGLAKRTIWTDTHTHTAMLPPRKADLQNKNAILLPKKGAKNDIYACFIETSITLSFKSFSQVLFEFLFVYIIGSTAHPCTRWNCHHPHEDIFVWI